MFFPEEDQSSPLNFLNNAIFMAVWNTITFHCISSFIFQALLWFCIEKQLWRVSLRHFSKNFFLFHIKLEIIFEDLYAIHSKLQLLWMVFLILSDWSVIFSTSHNLENAFWRCYIKYFPLAQQTLLVSSYSTKSNLVNCQSWSMLGVWYCHRGSSRHQIYIWYWEI